jgi:predicted acyl esterase
LPGRSLFARTILALGLATVLAAPASAAPRDDADHSEAYFPANDGLGTRLHADILRPKGMAADVQTPVVMTVSPYTNHGGVPTNDPALGHVNGQGPSERFYDFLNLTTILEQGYTYVMVDLPGFGGSGGCNDWGGNREQGAVKAAVEWASEQPWSNGRVALLGKSYDAWTGLMGINQQPKGLAAVVAMEPVYAGYRYLYNNGVRFTNSLLTPALFQAFDAQPGPATVDPEYQINGAPQAWCYGVNMGLQQQDDPNAPFWLERDLLFTSPGEATPLFLTQGFLETNTKPDGAFDYWNGLDGPHNRAWFGQFDHVRGWERTGPDGYTSGRYHMGREVFVEEMMRFLDLHLKGIEPDVTDPSVAVQDNRGRYRAEAQWPPEDMRVRWSDLNGGTYTDDGGISATGVQRVWTFSEPLPHDVWLSGEPVVKVRVDAPAPRTNVVADVFDVAPDGRARLINRGTYLLRGQGLQQATFDLYGQDWRLEAGHRIGIMVGGSDARQSGFWTHVPTRTTVTVRTADVALPFLTFERDEEEYLDGGSTPRLESHLGQTITITDETIAAGERELNLPPELQPRPKKKTKASRGSRRTSGARSG